MKHAIRAIFAVAILALALVTPASAQVVFDAASNTVTATSTNAPAVGSKRDKPTRARSANQKGTEASHAAHRAETGSARRHPADAASP